MKHKYLIEKDEEKNELLIKEFAELNKETFSFICQETYAQEKITAAIAIGREKLITALRTQNMYPSGLFAQKIADAVIAMHDSEPGQSVEIILDDIDFITKDHRKTKNYPNKAVPDDLENDSAEIDDLLEDDFDDNYDEKSPLKKINSSLKVMDDDYDNFDDEDDN